MKQYNHFSTLSRNRSENIIRILKVAGPKGVDTIALGTDYDGLITHFDCYPDSGMLPLLFEDLHNSFADNKTFTELKGDYSVAELLDKLFRKNSIEFLKKHF